MSVLHVFASNPYTADVHKDRTSLLQFSTHDQDLITSIFLYSIILVKFTSLVSRQHIHKALYTTTAHITS